MIVLPVPFSSYAMNLGACICTLVLREAEFVSSSNARMPRQRFQSAKRKQFLAPRMAVIQGGITGICHMGLRALQPACYGFQHFELVETHSDRKQTKTRTHMNSYLLEM